jgi:hypothetical protein
MAYKGHCHKDGKDVGGCDRTEKNVMGVRSCFFYKDFVTQAE